ncbi:ABC transporter permease [Halosimplex aquaticum]|uniref:ABC transporter permease n=1 Tax=Halosimplex aquaticum TaxID=3026162 RepID=A0ABD5Y1V9_9EURY|nr:ABC transporter permease [Halosimplex aquaticum]
MASSYFLKRTAHAVLVFAIVTSLAFAIFRLMPFGPVEMVRLRLMQQMSTSGSFSQAELDRINTMVETYTNINPDRPIPLAYVDYLEQVIVHQDLGRSFHFSKPVTEVLATRMQWSIFISVYGIALGRTTSLLLGAGMAYKEGSRFDKVLTGFSILNRTVPFYIVGIVVLIVFSFNLGWFPSGGLYNRAYTPGLNVDFMVSIVRHATLPVFASFIAGFGGALAYRGNCIRELGKGYIRVAHLRGISDARIAIRYVGRNSLLPIYTSLTLAIATVFSSSIILETIFGYPAMGYVTYEALLNRDYPLLMGSFMFFTAITLLGILVADLTYGIIDPRVKGGGDREAF